MLQSFQRAPCLLYTGKLNVNKLSKIEILRRLIPATVFARHLTYGLPRIDFPMGPEVKACFLLTAISENAFFKVRCTQNNIDAVIIYDIWVLCYAYGCALFV